MASPFRTDDATVRERAAELRAEIAELDALIVAARATRAGLQRRRRPLRAALVSKVAIALAVVGLVAGAWLGLRETHRCTNLPLRTVVL
jgi:hypothetical protein